MKNLINAILSVAVTFCVVCGLIIAGVRDDVVFNVALFVPIFVCAILGVFDGRTRTKKTEGTEHESIRHRDGLNYGQAAVFMGTACIFMGTPEQCEEVADDLWHYAQPARFEMLNGNETFEVL